MKVKQIIDPSPLKDEEIMIINVRAKDNNVLLSKDYGKNRLSDYKGESTKEEFSI